ncbi:hypothetical protein HKX48_005261 [Thoreauomyces humboldtii]|nr:hypothetical protein HKX48_005261 [Thoreauomyces humboldtii]
MSVATPSPQAAFDDPDELLRSFINEDLLEFPSLDLLQDLPDFQDLCQMPLDEPVKVQNTQSLYPMYSLSPEGTSNGRNFFSSPSSAATSLSPPSQWMLDFDEPLHSFPPLPVPTSLPAAESRTSNMPGKRLVPSSVTQWNFVDCSPATKPPVVHQGRPSPPLAEAATVTPMQQTISAQAQAFHAAEALKTAPLVPPRLAPAAPPTPALTKTTSLTPAEKKEQRLMRNRAAALESRKRKRAQLENLEVEYERAIAENARLGKKVAELQHTVTLLEVENNTLRQRLPDVYGRVADFGAGYPMRALEMPAAFEAPVLPNKKQIGTVLMTVFFSFALIFLPGFMSSTTHVGGHISGKAYSDYPAIQTNAGPRLLDAPPQILYLPAASTPSNEFGLVPVTSPAAFEIESLLSIPLDVRFGDMLATLADHVQRGVSHSDHLSQLQAIFGPSMTPAIVLEPASSGGLGDHAIHDHPLPGRQSHLPSVPAVPHIALTDSIHLLPFREQDVHTSTQEAASGGGPKLSLVATIPSPSASHGDSSSGFLQLDLQVINARLVRFNSSGSTTKA